MTGSRYLGYFVSFAFIGGVWIAHSTLTQFITAADPELMRLNLLLLLFVSFLTFHHGNRRDPPVRVELPGVVADLSHSSVFCSAGEGSAGRSGS